MEDAVSRLASLLGQSVSVTAADSIISSETRPVVECDDGRERTRDDTETAHA